MRMSCNGCRVLRKGCSEGCTIRPCLQWIKTPEAQANATVFLAKFYGRAGLLNLLAAGPDHLRPAVFRSLLYEACGRIVNPIYGSVGLLWSGQWQACQAAVEAVLKGDPVVQVSSEAAAAAQATPPLRAYDIRHVAKDAEADAAANLLRVARGGRTRFKRASSSSNSKHGAKVSGAAKRAASPSSSSSPTHEPEPEAVVVVGDDHDDDHHLALSHEAHEESAGSHDDDDDDHDHVEDGDNNMAVDDVPPRAGSEDTEVEAGSHVSQAEQSPVPVEHEEEEEVGLELTLGFQPLVRASRRPASAEARCDLSSLSAESSRIGLRLELPA
ncbi:hypothetical protein E2562_015081 [Oryza meyeriana var. granulata]|uniref:LOB domain-containing protein n=1 Tax=Oryza meyeriana var. granulata TaxID=110450 RepID=A0A6G1DXS6_9ORYZ|nr:hypothetical protein E2562_015081 [Oryza meyeriana var. granulata]